MEKPSNNDSHERYGPGNARQSRVRQDGVKIERTKIPSVLRFLQSLGGERPPVGCCFFSFSFLTLPPYVCRCFGLRCALYLEINEKLAVGGAGRAMEPAARVGHRRPVRVVLLLHVPRHLMHQDTAAKLNQVPPPRVRVDEGRHNLSCRNAATHRHTKRDARQKKKPNHLHRRVPRHTR